MKKLPQALACLWLVDLLVCAGCVSSKPGYSYERVERTRRAVGKAETAQWVKKIRPYALMSELAYRSDRVTGGRLKQQEIYRHDLESAGWQLLTNPNDPAFTNESSLGLHFYFWQNRTLPQPEIVIVFRGTESWDGLDWKANFRWLLPGARSHDQYEKARQCVFPFLEQTVSAANTNFVIITTGHSLGAGLAQAIFYSSYARPPGQQVTQCYAFDPSPVTGALQLGTRTDRKTARTIRDQTQAGMAGDKVKGESSLAHYDFGIVRVYEKGEILAYPRSWCRQVWPLHPLISELRFNFKDRGNPVSQHAMAVLAESLYEYDKCEPLKP